ncbi:MAG: helix-turn-helix domain-containing protein [Chloroflexota bacterium]
MSEQDERPVIEESSDNVFADLGVPNPEEELLKAQLARQVIAIITRRGLTQSEAAALLGVPQPNISALMNGRLKRISVERLIRFLNSLGGDVEIVVKAPTGTRGEARVSVGT